MTTSTLTSGLDARYWDRFVGEALVATRVPEGVRFVLDGVFVAFIGSRNTTYRESAESMRIDEEAVVDLGALRVGFLGTCIEQREHHSDYCPPVGMRRYDLLVEGVAIEAGASAEAGGFAIYNEYVGVRDDRFSDAPCADRWSPSFGVDIVAL